MLTAIWPDVIVDGDEVGKFELWIELLVSDDFAVGGFDRVPLPPPPILLLPELDDTVQVDDELIPLTNDGVVKCNWELVGVDG